MQNSSPRPQTGSAATSAVDFVAPTSTAGWVDTCEGATRRTNKRRERYRRRQTLIRHLFFVENWPQRLIARQLNVTRGYVARVINRAARLDAEVAP